MNWYTWPMTRDKQGVAIIIFNVRSKALTVPLQVIMVMAVIFVVVAVV